MDEKDLRIGNYYLYKGSEIKFDISDFSEIHHGLYGLLKPIPLTEERLIKLGAKGKNKMYWISLANLKAELHFEIFGSEIVTSIKSDFSNLILDRLKYVHTLQNLFRVLTGNELIQI